MNAAKVIGAVQVKPKARLMFFELRREAISAGNYGIVDGMPPQWFTQWQSAARQLKREIRALYLAVRDPRTPWYAKALATLVVAYALSPLDLIPDFVPVLGYVDDLLLLPVGVWLTLRLIPAEVMNETRLRAEAEMQTPKPVSWFGAALIVLLWVGAMAVTVWLVQRVLPARR